MTQVSVLRCLILLGMILIVTGGLSLQAQEKKRLTFDKVFRGGEPDLLARLPAVKGWEDEQTYLETRRDSGGVEVVYAVTARTGKERLVRNLHQYRGLVGDGIAAQRPAAANDSYTRLIYAKENDLYYLNTEKKEFRRLTESPAEEKNPSVSADGNFVAFTRDNDLYAVNLNTGKELRFTWDGGEVVYNGWASWVYYEEILGRPSRHKAFWWSPDSRRILFFRFDDSPVPIFPIYCVAGKHGYLEKTRYPKSGDPNPRVRVGVVAVSTPGNITWADFDEYRDQYFGPPFWTPDGKEIFVQWMNRDQDTLIIYSLDPPTGRKKSVYLEHQSTWVDWFEKIHFLRKSKCFILKSDKDGWSHFYLFERDGTLRKRLTSGQWSVESVQAVNEEKGVVFFTGKKEASTRRDLYRVRLEGDGLTRLTFGPYTHSVDLSPDGSFFVTQYSNLITPPRMTLCDGDGRIVRELGDSETPEFDLHAIAKSELVRIKTSDGVELPALWMLPTDFDPTRKYPVLFSVYGGPERSTVSESWPDLRDQWLAMEGMIQVKVDHRGSDHFGKEGGDLMYRNLGKWEMHDYIEAVKWLRAKPFVDSTRIGISGGSYGGYVTCLALTYGADYFTHGFAQSSVTDWELYDSHYTERYMETRERNPEGYAFSSVLTHAQMYKGMLGIVHGTMDDNVHMQNSLQLVDALQKLGKHFEVMPYPDSRHGWGGPKATHVRNEKYRFYYTYLLQKEFPESLFEAPPASQPRRRTTANQ